MNEPVRYVDKPSVSVTLVDGSNTWVCVYPIGQKDLIGVLEAIGWAFTHFTANVVRDKDAVERNLKNAAA